MNDLPTPTDQQRSRPARTRWLILGLLFAISVVTYIDRVNISVTARQMMPALGLTVVMILANEHWGSSWASSVAQGAISFGMGFAFALYLRIVIDQTVETSARRKSTSPGIARMPSTALRSRTMPSRGAASS